MSFQSHPFRFSNHLAQGLLVLLSILSAGRGLALSLEDHFLIYLEDFGGPEGQFTLPEVNELGSVLFSAISQPSTTFLVPENGFMRLGLAAGGDQVQSLSTVGGSGDFDSSSAGARMRFRQLSVEPGEAALSIGASVSSLIGSAAYVAIISLDIDWTTGGTRPVVQIEVGSLLVNVNTSQELQRSTQSLPVSNADIDLLVAGGTFTLDVILDNDLVTVSGSLDLEGGGATEVLSIAGLAQPSFNVLSVGAGMRADSVAGANPLVGTPSVDLDDFEAYVPFDEAYVVTSVLDAVDSSPGDGDCETEEGLCTLRAAIQESNANPGRSRITFSATTPTVYAQSLLGSNEDASATGDYDVLDDLVVRGRGIDQTRIDADGVDRVFHVPQTAMDTVFRLVDLTVENGIAADALSPAGGGIDTWGRTTLLRAAVEDNQAGFGAGIMNRRTLWLRDSRIVGNEAIGLPGGGGGRAGGIGGQVIGASGSDPLTTIRRSAIVDNTATLSIGGAEFAGSDSVVIEDSTLSGNFSPGFDRQIQLTNSNAFLRNVTIVGGNGGGLGFGTFGTPVELEIANSALVGSDACFLTANSAAVYLNQGHNASNDTSCGFVGPGDITGQDLELAPLAMLEGSWGHEPLETSPLIESAESSFCWGDRDQLSNVRPTDNNSDGEELCEMGAIEVPEPGIVPLLLGGVLGLGGLSRRAEARIFV